MSEDQSPAESAVPDPASAGGTSRGATSHRATSARTVSSLMSEASIEMTPREVLRSDGPPAVGAASRLYLTHVPSTPPDGLVEAATIADRWGLTPVPHLAARALGSERELDRLLGRLVDTAGVSDLLLIAGSHPAPAGPFASSIDVLGTGLVEGHGIASIGVAGHPEGAPDVGAADLATALDVKNRYAAESGVDVRIVTQFCFDAEPVLAWERRIRATGNRLPIHVGVAGLASPAKVVRFGLSCGVGPSLKMLRTQTGGVLRLATTARYVPDGVIAGIARGVADDPHSLISGIHFFPFGAVADTAGWIEAVRDGRFDLDATGAAIRIRPPR